MPTVDEYIRFGLLCVVLVPAAVMDWRTGKISNRLTFSGILAGVFLSGVAGVAGWRGDTLFTALGACGLGLLAGFVPLAIVFFAGGMGGGDVKLAAAVGAIGANWAGALGALVYAFTFAMLMAVVLMVHHRIVSRTLLRIFSAMLTLSVKVKPPMPRDSPPVPFGVALCLGGLLSGVEFLLHVPMPWQG